jgi:hypothetical protein
VSDHIEIALIASENGPLKWSLQFINQALLEDQYVSHLLSHKTEKSPASENTEAIYRKRFKHYMQTMSLFTAKEKPLEILAKKENEIISFQIE